jgi:hypothetical protein
VKALILALITPAAFAAGPVPGDYTAVECGDTELGFVYKVDLNARTVAVGYRRVSSGYNMRDYVRLDFLEPEAADIRFLENVNTNYGQRELIEVRVRGALKLKALFPVGTAANSQNNDRGEDDQGEGENNQGHYLVCAYE